MKINKNITVNDQSLPLVKDHTAIDISTPGRADFTVQAKSALSGVVDFMVGTTSMVNFFTGYIEKSITVDAKQQRIFCRELTAVLWNKIPVSARRVSLADVLSIYSRKTGLQFRSEGGETPVPVFQTMGNGIHGLDSLGRVFGIDEYIWQQQEDGVVYVGSWQDSKWPDCNVPVPEELFTDVQLDGTKTIAVVPGLRPGMKINDNFITAIQLIGHEMVVKCETQLDAL
ncbi:MAG: hypothetical protein OCC45_10445 [Desulfotalea sp.]